MLYQHILINIDIMWVCIDGIIILGQFRNPNIYAFVDEQQSITQSTTITIVSLIQTRDCNSAFDIQYRPTLIPIIAPAQTSTSPTLNVGSVSEYILRDSAVIVHGGLCVRLLISDIKYAHPPAGNCVDCR